MHRNNDALAVTRLGQYVMTALDTNKLPALLSKGANEIFPGNLFQTASSRI